MYLVIANTADYRSLIPTGQFLCHNIVLMSRTHIDTFICLLCNRFFASYIMEVVCQHRYAYIDRNSTSSHPHLLKALIESVIRNQLFIKECILSLALDFSKLWYGHIHRRRGGRSL